MTLENSFLDSVDTHNIANGDDGWFARKISATGELGSDIGEAITKGGIGAVVAGVDSILNTGIAVANFVGTDIKPIDTYKVLKGFDDDLGKYYKEHQQGVELAGFALGAFIPGMAGVKALQAAKAGFLGKNMLASGGLMQTLTADYAAAAKVEMASSGVFSVFEANTVKSLIQGVGSQALDALAFEVTAAASMYQSPILKEQSASDLFWNIATGTVLGAGIGGVLSGVSTVAGIKRSLSAVDRELFPYREIREARGESSSDMKLLTLYQQKFNMPEARLSDLDIKSELTNDQRIKMITDTREKTLARIENLIQQEFNSYAGGDILIGQQLYKHIGERAKSFEDVAAAILHSKNASRITQNETIEFGDTLFPKHGNLSVTEFEDIAKNGNFDSLFVPSATSNTQGFRVIGDTKGLQIARAGQDSLYGNRDAAFSGGIDLFRNHNGTFSVNPESKILQRTDLVRTANNLVLDLEHGADIVDKATPGLADLATSANPIIVKDNTILYGNRDPIKVQDGASFNPAAESYLDVQARYIWAQEQKNIFWPKKVVNENDLPLLERAYYDGNKAVGFIIKKEDGSSINGPTGEALKNFIESKKTEFVQKLAGKPYDELSYRLNVSDSWLNGEADELAKIRPGVDYNLPRYARVDYGQGSIATDSLNAARLDGAVDYQRQVQLIKSNAQNTFANFAGDKTELFIPAPDLNNPNRIPTREGAGASLLGFANSNYGTYGAWAQYTGTQTNSLKLLKVKEMLTPLNPAVAQVAASKELTAEAALINNRLLQSDKAWVFHPSNPLALIKREDFTAVSKGAKPTEQIDISDAKIADFWRTHRELNGTRQEHIANMKSEAGVGDDHDYNVVYPVPVDTTKLKHFVIVKPIGISLSDKARVIAAKDVSTLKELVDQVDKNEFRVLTKEDSAEYHKAIGDYEYSLGFNESAVDSSLKREGKLSQHFPTINEGFLERVVEWHTKQEEMLSTKMVQHLYSQDFKMLQSLGKEYTNFETSQFRKNIEALANQAKDPYNDYVKTALDISRSGEYQWWKSFNDTIKEAIEGPINKLRDVFATTKQIDTGFVDKINKISQDLGLGTPYQTAHSVLLANKNIPDKPWLTVGIAKAQALMSSTLLQFDFFNAVNNVLGSPIISSPEMNSLFKAIRSQGSPEQLSRFENLLSVSPPTNNGPASLKMFTTAKLQRNALVNFIDDKNDVLLNRYKEINAVTDTIYQQRQMIKELSFDFGKETEGTIGKKLTNAAEFARKWTGNTLAEQTTRFMAADIARQITDHAVEAGILKSTKEADEYIQLFVNRTQGNYLYSQRPIVFQGVVGQAISLFQTYQFNLMQQLFRYVGEGEGKNIAMLLGLQGSIYGMQGLPAFNFVNTHIVGNASGNTEHKDLYFASNSVFGKTLGDWMLYGAGSNALGLVDSRMRFNLYSRGDINPRNVTVLPTQISDVPVIAASVGFVSNLWNASEKLAKGASLWPTISQAVEHNGLSRPLAGLAQVAQGYTTTTQGSLLSSSRDSVNVAQATRVLGGKPFDEAVALDALYRVNAYKAKDIAKIQELGAAVRTSMVGNGEPSEDQVTNFAKEYAKNGGRIENFNKFMANMMLGANKSQVNKLAENINSPFSKQMQVIMGGVPLEDFRNAQ